MKANIRNREGLEEVEILKEPFTVRGVKLFVYREKHTELFVITEWQTGLIFTRAQTEQEIKPAIKTLFNRVNAGRMQEKINEAIAEYGTANKEV